MKSKIKYVFLLLFIFSSLESAFAQKIFTRSGEISFYSQAPLEKIEAHNSKVTSIIDLETGRLEFAVLIKAFLFEKALMQEHFNENYMESDKFPKSTFKGNIDNFDPVLIKEESDHKVIVSGLLTIHGIELEIQTPATISKKDGNYSAKAQIEIAVADFNIEIPAVVRDNIAKTVEIMIQCDYEELPKK